MQGRGGQCGFKRDTAACELERRAEGYRGLANKVSDRSVDETLGAVEPEAFEVRRKLGRKLRGQGR